MQESGKEHKHQNPVFRHYHENPSKNREKFLLPQLTWKERFNTNIAEVTYAECNIDPIQRSREEHFRSRRRAYRRSQWTFGFSSVDLLTWQASYFPLTSGVRGMRH